MNVSKIFILFTISFSPVKPNSVKTLKKKIDPSTDTFPIETLRIRRYDLEEVINFEFNEGFYDVSYTNISKSQAYNTLKSNSQYWCEKNIFDQYFRHVTYNEKEKNSEPLTMPIYRSFNATNFLRLLQNNALAITGDSLGLQLFSELGK